MPNDPIFGRTTFEPKHAPGCTDSGCDRSCMTTPADPRPLGRDRAPGAETETLYARILAMVESLDDMSDQVNAGHDRFIPNLAHDAGQLLREVLIAWPAPRPADAAAVGDCIGLGAKCARPCGPDGRCAQADVRDAPKVAAAHSHLLDLVLSRKYSGASLQKAIRAVIDAAASAALATPPAADARGAEIARLRDMLTRVAETQMALAVDDADHQRAAFGSEDAQPSTDAERERIEEDADGALGAVLAWWEARRAAGGEVR